LGNVDLGKKKRRRRERPRPPQKPLKERRVGRGSDAKSIKPPVV